MRLNTRVFAPRRCLIPCANDIERCPCEPCLLSRQTLPNEEFAVNCRNGVVHALMRNATRFSAASVSGILWGRPPRLRRTSRSGHAGRGRPVQVWRLAPPSLHPRAEPTLVSALVLGTLIKFLVLKAIENALACGVGTLLTPGLWHLKTFPRGPATVPAGTRGSAAEARDEPGPGTWTPQLWRAAPPGLLRQS